MKLPKMDPVESSMFSQAGFDETTQTAYLTFKHNATTYSYPTMPKEVYEALRAAESMGKFFGQNVRKQYPGTAADSESTANSPKAPGDAQPPAESPEPSLVA